MYIEKDFIELINFRGLYKPQKKAYRECYDNNKNYYDWIAFFDLDEYLYIPNYSNIKVFLSLSKFNKCSSLLINWKIYGDNNNLYYEPKPLQKRFKIPSKKKIKNKYLNSASKSIVRGKLNISWGHFPHFLKNINICRGDGKIVENPFSSPNYNDIYIRHYTTKSTEEYAQKLIKGTVNSRVKNFSNFVNKRIRSYYFLINKKTKNKINLFQKILNLNESDIFYFK